MARYGADLDRRRSPADRDSVRRCGHADLPSPLRGASADWPSGSQPLCPAALASARRGPGHKGCDRRPSGDTRHASVAGDRSASAGLPICSGDRCVQLSRTGRNGPLGAPTCSASGEAPASHANALALRRCSPVATGIPPLRLHLRLTVDAARTNILAIARTDWPSQCLEISPRVPPSSAPDGIGVWLWPAYPCRSASNAQKCRRTAC